MKEGQTQEPVGGMDEKLSLYEALYLIVGVYERSTQGHYSDLSNALYNIFKYADKALKDYTQPPSPVGIDVDALAKQKAKEKYPGEMSMLGYKINAQKNNQEKFIEGFKAGYSASLHAQKSVGQILKEAIELHDLNPSVVENELDFPKGILSQVLNDEFYTNSVPVVLFKNLLMSLHIPFATIEPAMIPTFKLVLSKETQTSIKKKPHGYMLWENEESVLKYTSHLKEIMTCQSTSSLPVTGESEAIGESKFTKSQILQAAKDGEVSIIDAEFIVSMLEKSNQSGERTFTLEEALEIHNDGFKSCASADCPFTEQYFKDKFGIDI